MANFYATYSASNASSATVTALQGTVPWVVDGQGTPGAQTGGVLTVQGDPSGTPVPISGNITASSANVAPTGGAVPADAGYIGIDNGSGTLVGALGDSARRQIIAGAGTAGTPAGGVVSVQGVASGTNLPVSQATAANLNATVVQGTAANLNATVVQGTAANLNATVTGSGSAGTAATGVVTVQGIASMTPLLVTQSGSGTQQNTNVAQFGGSNVVTGTGVGGSGIPRVTVSSDSTLTSVTTVSTVTTVSAVTAITNALPAGTNLLGKVGIDQTTPGTTNAIQATSGTTATWQAEGAIAAASITTSYQTVFTPSAGTKIIMVRNNTNQPVALSFDAGTTQNFVFDAGDQTAIDFIANGLQSTTTAIQIKYTGSAPTTGTFRVNGCH